MKRSALAAWTELDAGRALHPLDHDVIQATEAARSLVLDLFAVEAPARDLFSACARLGALMAEGGASPSLTAGTVDAAARALAESGAPFDVARVAPARASLIEGYVAAVRDAVHASALASWEYPACVVPLGDGAVAIACGFPTDDEEALAAWAAHLAGRLGKAKVRRAVLSGTDAAMAEVKSALSLVGIDVGGPHVLVGSAQPHERGATARSPVGWLRLPWRK